MPLHLLLSSAAETAEKINDVLFTESLLAKKYEKTGRVWTVNTQVTNSCKEA